MLDGLFIDTEKRSVAFFAKIFLVMSIPGIGLFYTMILAFLSDEDTELRRLARGALIVRGIVVIFAFMIFAGTVLYIIPNIENWLNGSNLWMKIFI